MFNIIDTTTKKLLANDATGELVVFETAVQALDIIKMMSNPRNYQLRKVVEETDWRSREQVKFSSGEYVLPEFLKQYSLPDHFLHVSKDKSLTLAYTKDEVKGRQNIQSRITVSGYLQIFQKHLCKATIDSLERRFKDVYEFEDGLIITQDPDEIVKAYRIVNTKCKHVTGSCMQPKFRGLPKHPTYAYGGGDLALAYLRDHEGKTTQRSICWPEKKIYGRIYGDSKIADLLKKRGYKPSRYYSEDNPSFAGARLRAIPLPRDENVYLMPFFDEKYLFAYKEQEYLVLCNDSSAKAKFGVSNTFGATRSNPTLSYICDVCEKPLSSHDGTILYTYENKVLDDIHCCNSCGGGYYHCGGSQRNFVNSVPKHLVEGEIYSQYGVDCYTFTCHYSGVLTRTSNAITVYDLDEKGQKVYFRTSRTWAKANTFVCQGLSHYYKKDKFTPVTVFRFDNGHYHKQIWEQSNAQQYAKKLPQLDLFNQEGSYVHDSRCTSKDAMLVCYEAYVENIIKT